MVKVMMVVAALVSLSYALAEEIDVEIIFKEELRGIIKLKTIKTKIEGPPSLFKGVRTDAWSMTLLEGGGNNEYGPEPEIQNGRVAGPARKYCALLELAVADYKTRAKDEHTVNYQLSTDGFNTPEPAPKVLAFKTEDGQPASCRMQLAQNETRAHEARLAISWVEDEIVHYIERKYLWMDTTKQWQERPGQPFPSAEEKLRPEVLEK